MRLNFFYLILELESALNILPYHYIQRLLVLLVEVLSRIQVDIEVITRCVIYILNTHGNRIITTADLHVPMMKLKQLIKMNVSRYSRVIGTNIATCNYIHNKLLEQQEWSESRKLELNPLNAPITATLKATKTVGGATSAAVSNNAITTTTHKQFKKPKMM